MPAETEQVIETPTATARDLKAKTDAAVAAVQGGGFSDPEFEKSLQEAIDKDNGISNQTPNPEADPEPSPDVKIAAKPEAKKTEIKPAPGTDLPTALLKKQEPKKEEAASATADERQKFLDEQTKGMTPKAAARFKMIEGRAYEAEQKAKKLEAERAAEKIEVQKRIEEAKAAIPNQSQTEVEALKKQLEEMDAIVKKANIESHPGFKASFDQPIASEIESVKKVVPADIADDLAHLISLPESARRNEKILQLTDKLDSITQQKIYRSMVEVDRLQAKRSSELANWKENHVHAEAYDIRKQQENAAKMKEIQDVAWAKGIGIVSSPEDGLEVYQKVEGEDEWNAAVEERMVKAKKLLNNPNIPPEALVEIAARAVATDDYRRMFFAQRSLVQKLSEELEAARSANPNVDGSAASGNETDNDDFITAVTKGAVKAGGVKA